MLVPLTEIPIYKGDNEEWQRQKYGKITTKIPTSRREDNDKSTELTTNVFSCR